jgi:hypothetical protein
LLICFLRLLPVPVRQIILFPYEFLHAIKMVESSVTFRTNNNRFCKYYATVRIFKTLEWDNINVANSVKEVEVYAEESQVKTASILFTSRK